ncbi:MAG: serine/threonine protein kinase [Treponema sp.]|nr:serine/threonine protein kinase [Treponema sp.]
MAEIPAMIGKYKVVSEIARGGMGIVYKAVHPQLKRFIIIKKLTMRGNAAVRERFKREARILLDLHHANIVHLFDYFTEATFHYIVLEYVDGMSLDKYLKKRQKLSAQTAMLIFRDACLALKYAHENGIVHRDIKPGNLLISRRGEVKLADFGIASTEKESTVDSELTQAGITLGTPSYMPPEQFTDTKSVDGRADIYAMGVMLYEIVTGKKPFPGSFSPETISLIQKGKYVAPEKLEKNIPSEVSRLIKKMIQPNPRKRFQSANQILKRVNKYLAKYDTENIRKELENGICTEKYTEPVFNERNKFLKRVAKGSLYAILTFGLFVISWQNGIIHETILKPWFTPVKLTMSLPSSASSNADLPIRAFFFVNDAANIPEVDNTRRVFLPTEKSSATKFQSAKINKNYYTKNVYLKPGNYRIKVVTGPYIWWQSIVVGKKAEVVNLDFLKNARRILSVKPFAFDAETKENISGKAKFLILYNGHWTNLTDVKPELLSSGTIHKVRILCEGYKTEEFSLRIEWYQDELFISAQLQKK